MPGVILHVHKLFVNHHSFFATFAQRALAAFAIRALVSSDSELLAQMSQAQCDNAEQFSTGNVLKKGKPLGISLFPGKSFYEVQDAQGGDIAKIFIVGCIAYRDAFYERHTTRFCYRSFNPNMKDGEAFEQCKVFSDAN